MKAILTILFTVIGSSFSASAAAESSDYEFSFYTGSAIIYCALANKNDVLPIEVFNAAFPLWMTNLLEHAEDGRVGRAHALNKLKSGVFVLVHGNSPAEAMENAHIINDENHQILMEAGLANGIDFDPDNAEICQILPIGPELIGPQ